MITMITSLFLFSLAFSFLTHTLVAITPLTYVSIIRGISKFASYKVNFELGTPTCRTVCPIRSIYRYNIIQVRDRFLSYG